MGMDAYADIYFGFPISTLPWQDYDSDSFDEDAEEVDEEPEDRLCRLLGIVEPTVEYTDDTKGLFSAYWAEKRAAEEAQTCSLETCYDYEEKMYHVECKRASVHTSWDSSKQFDPKSFGDEATMRGEIFGFCAFMGIPFEEPGWYLKASFS